MSNETQEASQASSDAAPEKPAVGSIGWLDTTVADADGLRDFYAAVVGWQVHPMSMGDYDDYTMLDASGKPAAGVCHKRGKNADLPSGWLIYITVADLAASLEACTAQGGTILNPARQLGEYGQMAVIRDPSGGTLALFESA
ncbi:MAG: VOC family protein [Acidobacteriota bacterium]